MTSLFGNLGGDVNWADLVEDALESEGLGRQQTAALQQQLNELAENSRDGINLMFKQAVAFAADNEMDDGNNAAARRIRNAWAKPFVASSAVAAGASTPSTDLGSRKKRDVRGNAKSGANDAETTPTSTGPRETVIARRRKPKAAVGLARVEEEEGTDDDMEELVTPEKDAGTVAVVIAKESKVQSTVSFAAMAKKASSTAFGSTSSTATTRTAAMTSGAADSSDDEEAVAAAEHSGDTQDVYAASPGPAAFGMSGGAVSSLDMDDQAAMDGFATVNYSAAASLGKQSGVGGRVGGAAGKKRRVDAKPTAAAAPAETAASTAAPTPSSTKPGVFVLPTSASAEFKWGKPKAAAAAQQATPSAAAAVPAPAPAGFSFHQFAASVKAPSTAAVVVEPKAAVSVAEIEAVEAAAPSAAPSSWAALLGGSSAATATSAAPAAAATTAPSVALAPTVAAAFPQLAAALSRNNSTGSAASGAKPSSWAAAAGAVQQQSSPSTGDADEEGAEEEDHSAGDHMSVAGTVMTSATSMALTEKQLKNRERDIALGKGLPSYTLYTEAVPVEARQRRKAEHPVTPDRSGRYSKRQWDGLVLDWKRRIHLWDAQVPAAGAGAAAVAEGTNGTPAQ